MWSKHGMVWYRLREAFSGFANTVDGLSKPKGPSFECAARHSFPPSASSLAICVCSRASSKPRNFSRDARFVFPDAAGASVFALYRERHEYYYQDRRKSGGGDMWRGRVRGDTTRGIRCGGRIHTMQGTKRIRPDETKII